MQSTALSTVVSTVVSTAMLIAVLLAGLTAALTAAPLFAAEPVTEPGYRMVVHGELAGPHNIWISKSGFRADNIKGGFSIVSKAPGWQVTIVNNRSRKFFVEPRNKFQGEVSSQIYRADQKEIRLGHWFKVGTEKLSTVDTTHYTMYPKTGQGNGNKNVITEANLWIFENANMPPEALNVLEEIFLLPTIRGLPIKFQYYTEPGVYASCPALDTDLIESVKVNVSQYNCAPGYQLAKSEREALVDPVSQGVFDGFADLTNLGGLGDLKH